MLYVGGHEGSNEGGMQEGSGRIPHDGRARGWSCWPVLLALMRYEKIVAGIGLGIVCFVIVAALGCIVYEVVKAHGSLSTALADAKADLAKAEATVESLVTAAKKAV